MWFLRIIGFLHLAIYVGIMWWGWKSYRILRKQSWLYMGIGFTFLLLNRTAIFYQLMTDGDGTSARSTITPFIGAVFLLIAFWKLSQEHHELIERMGSRPQRQSAGAQPVEFWQDVFRKIVSEEIAKSKQSE